MHANKREEIKEVYAGDIAAAVGLRSVTTGDTICDEKQPIVLEAMEFPEPVISLAIEPRTKADQEKLGQGLGEAAGRGPDLQACGRTRRPARSSSAGMGELHLEILVDRLAREFGVEASVGRPQVAYKETLTQAAERRGPLHPADRRPRPVRPRQDPRRAAQARRGVRVRQRDRRRRDPARVHQAGRGGHPRGDVRRRARRLPGRRRERHAQGRVVPRGRLVGAGVQDRRLDGVQGRGEEGDARCCSSRSCASRWSCPRSTWATSSGDLTGRRGRIVSMEARGGTQIVNARVPLSEMFGYATDLRSRDAGARDLLDALRSVRAGAAERLARRSWPGSRDGRSGTERESPDMSTAFGDKIRIRLKAYRLARARPVDERDRRDGAPDRRAAGGADPAADREEQVDRPPVAPRGQEVARAVRDPDAQAADRHLRADAADRRRADEARPAGRAWTSRSRRSGRTGSKMVTGILGKKVGMTQFFREDGTVEPVTVIKAGPCVVVQAKTRSARRLRGGTARARRGAAGPRAGSRSPGTTRRPASRRPACGARSKLAPGGDPLKAGRPGARVPVRRRRPGRRHRHQPRPRLPGRHQAPPLPRRRRHARLDVPPGARVRSAPRRTPRASSRGCGRAGRMGGERVTTRNLRVAKVDAEHNLLLLRGGDPRRGGRLRDRPQGGGGQARADAPGREAEGEEVGTRCRP